MNKIDLSGRNAIVTGGAQGFGLEISQRFIDSGAKVMIWDIDKKLIDSLQTKLDKHSSFFDIVDVTDFSSVSEGVNNAIRKLGKVDIFVNNAGITGPNETTWDYPIDDWRKVIEVDLNGVFYCSKSIVPHMIENNYGRIVNIASIAGKEGNPNAPAYSSAKAAVIALTKSLGKELSQYSISVNCVTPSAAKTRIFDQM
ncbi:MAG: SDR family oxidoreductase, partial [SAR202 cluster bacterium]|nr:SDR family oxidoreductase [SAR202 cluster bacterium]